MNKKAIDPIVLLTGLAGIVGSGLLAGLGASIDVWAPGWGKTTVSVLTTVSLAAALIVYLINNRTPTNVATVTDHATGLPVQIATVAAPGDPPAPVAAPVAAKVGP